LIGALAAILIQFYIELHHFLLTLDSVKESSLVLNVLGVIDFTLIGGGGLLSIVRRNDCVLAQDSV